MHKIFIMLSLLLSFSSYNGFAEEEYGKGLVFDDSSYQQVPLRATMTRSLYDDVPSRFSLKPYSPIPKNQGKYGTCTAWSTAYAARTILEAIRNEWTDKKVITEKAFSPGFIYRSIQTDSDCEKGSSIEKALRTMVKFGVPRYQDFDSACPDEIPNNAYATASRYKIKGFSRLFCTQGDGGCRSGNSNAHKIKVVKKSLAEGKPVIIAMNTPPSFNSSVRERWQPASTEDPSTIYGNGHAMTVIGYDDAVYGGAFEIQNSWGSRWGKGGYVWMKYNDFANFIRYGFELMAEPKISTDNKTPDLSGSVRLVLASSGEIQATWDGQIYKTSQSYPANTQFRIYLSNREPAYVYAFGWEMSNETSRLFPHHSGISPYLDYKRNDVPLPSETDYIKISGTPGKDFLCILYSKEELDLDEIQQKITEVSGIFTERLKKVLKDKLVNGQHINYAPAKMGFTALSQGKSVVPLVIEIAHDL